MLISGQGEVGFSLRGEGGSGRVPQDEAWTRMHRAAPSGGLRRPQERSRCPEPSQRRLQDKRRHAASGPTRERLSVGVHQELRLLRRRVVEDVGVLQYRAVEDRERGETGVLKWSSDH
jgi:hypothetical protein